MGILQQLNRVSGITVVRVTHEPDIAAYTNRILRLRDGLLSTDERVPQQRSAAAELAKKQGDPLSRPDTLGIMGLRLHVP